MVAPSSVGQTATTGVPGLARRLASMLYECLLLIGVLATMVLLPHVIYAMNVGQAAAPWLLQSHVVATLAIYFVWFWRHGGQTLAMKTWKIRLTSTATSGVVSLPQALLRFVLCWPSLFFFGAGLVWALFDRDRQFMHDRLAGTRLVDTR